METFVDAPRETESAGEGGLGFEEIRLLEERIEALLGALQRLREEKRDLEERLRDRDQEVERLRGELARLREERENIKGRVRSLLEKIDQCSTA